MKKWPICGLLLIIVTFMACGTATANESGTVEAVSAASSASVAKDAAWLQDGVYIATEDTYSPYSGWKYVVTLEVQDGSVTSVDWDAAHKDGGESKKVQSMNGTYGMNGAEGAWHEQAEKAISYFMDNHATLGTVVPDAIAGVSMGIDPLFTLATQALMGEPVGYGPYVDGAYSAIEPNTGGSWRYTGDFTVISGYIVSANWDAVHKDGGDTKKVRSLNGTYGMKGAQGTWHEQAARVEAALLENQGAGAIEFTEGKTDDIAGVSISTEVLFTLASEALVLR